MSLPRYVEYKDSGTQWLGQIPKHWGIDRFKWSISYCKNGIWGDEPTGTSTDIPCVRVADFDRPRLRVKENIPTLRSVTENERANRILAAGNLLLEKSGGGELNPVGQVVIYQLNEPAVCSNFVAKMTLAKGMVPEYWNYVHSAAYSIGLNIGSINQTSGIQNLDQQRYFNEIAPFPPQVEQTAIATFLDRETAKIDTLIAEQEKLLTLLAEKRQTTISHAVTKGLNSNAPMKDSGVEWLGKVPEHWNMKRLKFVAHVQTGIAKGKDNTGKETITVPYLRVANVQDGFLALEDMATIDIEPNQLERYRLRTNDVLMNEGGDYDKLGRGAVWNGEVANCIHQNHVFAVRPHGIESSWLNRITSSAYAQFYFMSQSKQSTNLASISSTNVMELPLPVPPRDECVDILKFIDAEFNKLRILEIEGASAISLLKERRSVLIAAAVTGQIDVRDAVAEASPA